MIHTKKRVPQTEVGNAPLFGFAYILSSGDLDFLSHIDFGRLTVDKNHIYTCG